MSRSRTRPSIELVAPDDDRLEGQRALAQAGDHRLAAGLDALGDGDLALARQQLDRAHLAQVHAHRIVGAVGRLLRRGLADRDRPRRRLLDELAAFVLVVVGRHRPRRRPGRPSSASSASTTLMPMSESMASVSSICSEVTSSDGSTCVQLVIGDVAALLGGLDHLLDGGIGQVEQRAVRFRQRLGVAFGVFAFGRLRRHAACLYVAPAALAAAAGRGKGGEAFGPGHPVNASTDPTVSRVDLL